MKEPPRDCSKTGGAALTPWVHDRAPLPQQCRYSGELTPLKTPPRGERFPIYSLFREGGLEERAQHGERKAGSSGMVRRSCGVRAMCLDRPLSKLRPLPRGAFPVHWTAVLHP